MRLYLPPEAELKLREAVSRDDVGKFCEFASPLKWGKPSWSASQLMMQVLGGDQKRLWLWASNLAKHVNPQARMYASGVLLQLWGKGGNRAERILTSLADDDHWLVREEAHSVWGTLLSKNFGRVSTVLESFVTNPSANLRRYVAIAVRKAGNSREEGRAKALFGLLEPLLSDKNPYVRKNVGPFAIGDGLLRCFPSITLRHLRRWAKRKDEGTLWNVAMSFASYGGSKNWREGMKILSCLATDERRYVWRSAASALLYLARRHVGVQDTLKTWSKDPKRARVAETVLKHLK